MTQPIIDFHCDLLLCTEDLQAQLHFYSPETNCSLDQLSNGNVRVQTFAIATVTNQRATASAYAQGLLYQKLLLENSEHISSIQEYDANVQKIYGLISIENASGLIEEDEPLEFAFQRLEFLQTIENILYLSLTWNHENRFGGGNSSSVGLKPDGKILLEFLEAKNIAIDLSHASDALARDIFNYIDQKNLQLTPIASHSNFRKIAPITRNLPDDIAKEIFARGGVVGLNLIRRFVGPRETDLYKHIQHALDLGGASQLVLGSDFYGGIDVPAHLMPEKTWPTFFPDFANAACYPHLYAFLNKQFPTEIVGQITFHNALRFIQNKS